MKMLFQWLFLGWLWSFTFPAEAVTLNILEWEGYISPYAQKFDQFAKARGKDIKLNILQPFITNPTQIFEAVRGEKADVVTPTFNYYKMSSSQLLKVLTPLDYRQLSNYPHVLKSLQKAQYDELDGQKYAVPLLGGSYGLAYNADIVKEPPTSWNALWEERYRGKFAVTDDQFEANLYITLLVLGYPPESVYDIDKTSFDEKAVQEKLNQLVKNAKAFWPGEDTKNFPAMTQSLELVTTYWLGIAFANKAGQNWKLASPKEGETVWLDTLAIAGHLKHNPEKLEAAYLLLDFMISPEIQAQLYRDYGSIIVNPEASKLLTSEQVKEGRIGDETFFKPEFFWQPLTARTRNSYKKMWKLAKENAGIPLPGDNQKP